MKVGGYRIGKPDLKPAANIGKLITRAAAGVHQTLPKGTRGLYELPKGLKPPKLKE